MIFKHYNTEAVARIFFNCYFIGTLFLGTVALYGMISGAGVRSTLSGFTYLVVVSLLTLNKRFRESPFSVLFCFFTFLYLNLPVAFVLYEGSNYSFGVGLASVPYEQGDYHQALSFSFMYLLLCWFAIWIGIISIKQKRREVNNNRFPVSVKSILLLGIVVLVVAWIDNNELSAVHLTGDEKKNSILTFIFFDHAYLVLVGIILFFKLNKTKNTASSLKLTSIISLIFIGFVILQFIAGSKASILMILTLLVLYTLGLSKGYPGSKILFPQPKFFLVFLLLSPLLFYFSLIQRVNLSSGISPDLNTLLAGISLLETNMVYDILKEILYRFSHGGLDRFILIFQSFIIDGFHYSTAIEFVNYLFKNTANLLLPGTPFPESYAPSSQLFIQVIQKNLVGWDGGVDPNALIKKLNTQPYTIFGVFTVIFGITAPIFLYLCTVFFTFIFTCINNFFMRITMLYFFANGLVSFGIEVVLGNSVHLFVSILFMYFLMKILSRINFKLPSKSIYLQLPGSK